MLTFESFFCKSNFTVLVRYIISSKEKEFENANEYLSAFAAHSTYWNNKDLCLFINERIKIGIFNESQYPTNEISRVPKKESVTSSIKIGTEGAKVIVRSSGQVACSVQFWEELSSKSL